MNSQTSSLNPNPQVPSRFSIRRALLGHLAHSGNKLLFDKSSFQSLIVIFFVIKMLVTLWNSYAYQRPEYDVGYHLTRIRTMREGPRVPDHNPPLYYLPAVFIPPGLNDGVVLQPLRSLNVVYLFTFYALWVFYIFPRLFADWKQSTLASLVLLALPGYQKMAAMVNPDNLINLGATACFAAWMAARRQPQTRGTTNWPNLMLFAALVGLTGLTRPSAIIVVAAFSAALVTLMMERHAISSRGFWLRVIVGLSLCVGPLYGWKQYQRTLSRPPGPSKFQAYMAPFDAHRADVSRMHYLTTFYFKKLLEFPNRRINTLDKKNPWYNNRFANSFWTTLYSDFWGDHWLYFSSSRRNQDSRVWEKRAVFVVGLPLTLLLITRIVVCAASLVKSLRKRLFETLEHCFLFSFSLFFLAIFLYWQLGQGFEPGKQSTIKFTYIASVVPFLLGSAWTKSVRSTYFNVVSAYGILLFVVALPAAVYWPLDGQ